MSIPANIQQHIFDLLNKTSSVSFVSAEKLDTSALKLSPGEIVTAEVVSILPYNRAEVTIGTTRVNLELPLAVKVGQNLELTYVADDPRPTFAMPRIGEPTPPVRLSDASRLLGMLLGNNQIANPEVRASLMSVSQLLHQTDGDTSLLASVLDEALTYTPQKIATAAAPGTPTPLPQDQTAKNIFESNASQILQQVARNARFTMVEAVNQPVTPLPLMPGEEVNVSVLGTLPGGRVFVQVAGTPLELKLPHPVPQDGIIRLTYLSSLPKPLFALQRTIHDLSPGSLSEASRWLSVLEHSSGGISGQQMNVLERLNTVISSLPPDSPAFTAIRDEALTYDTILKRTPQETGTPAATLLQHQQQLQNGNGIVLHDDMAKLLQALIKGNRLALLEAINQQAMPTGLLPGQQVRGDVLASLGGGRFMLDVAGKAMEFALPRGVGVGSRLQLFFITADPGPTFLLARFGAAGDSSVSSAGRWIGNLLETTPEGSGAAKTARLLSIILGEPPTDPAHVSQTLEKNLKGSGLFYESHLTRWFGGEYPLDEILKEPQGKLSSLKQMALNQHQELADESGQTMKLAPERVMVQEGVRHGIASTGAEGMADPRTLPIVQEQLATLQNGQLLFKGELFQGQQMEWSVREREAQRNRDGSRERSWETTLALELPRLGSIKAEIVLEEGRVSVRMSAKQAATGEKLEHGKRILLEQLEAAGLDTEEIRVLHE